MNRRSFASLLPLGVLLTLAPTAHASRLQLRPIAVVSGNDQPGLVIQPEEAVTSLQGTLRRDDGRVVRLATGAIAAGAERTLTVPQEPGTRHSYAGTLEVRWASGETSTFEPQLTLTRMNKIALQLRPEDVDLDARQMRFTLNNPSQRAELVLVGQDGQPMHTVTQPFAGAAAGSPLSLSWPAPPGDLLYMDLKVYDVGEFWTGVRLTPFSITGSINVEFDSGRWNIRASEEPKLREKVQEIQGLLRKFEKTGLRARLYIAGYTDTVGDKGSNRVLSNNRARSIGSWFRSNGLAMPMFYHGYGEDVLAKPTPDETPEQANRRVLFVFAAASPTGSSFPQATWQPL